MGHNSMDHNFNKQNSGVKSPPPPYGDDQPNADFDNFPQTNPKLFTPETTAQPPMNLLATTLSVTPNSPPATPPISGFGFSSKGHPPEQIQEDIFKKPPKFLLYPSLTSENTREPSDFIEVGSQPLKTHNETVSGLGQTQTPSGIPPVFSVADSLEEITSGSTETGPPIDGFMPRHSQRVICPFCKISVETEVQFVNGSLTHIAACVCCWFCCCLVVLPYYLDDLKDCEHYCPKCSKMVGNSKKMTC